MVLSRPIVHDCSKCTVITLSTSAKDVDMFFTKKYLQHFLCFLMIFNVSFCSDNTAVFLFFDVLEKLFRFILT